MGWREAARTAVVDNKVQIGAERVDAPVHCLISPRAHLGQIHRMRDDVSVSLNLTRWHGEVGIWRVMAAATVPCGELIEYTCRLEMRDLNSAVTGRVGRAAPAHAVCRAKKVKDDSDVAGGSAAYYSIPLSTLLRLTKAFPALRATRDCESPPPRPRFTYSSCSLLRLFFRRSTGIGAISSPLTFCRSQKIQM